jgi:hypothetical protein
MADTATIRSKLATFYFDGKNFVCGYGLANFRWHHTTANSASAAAWSARENRKVANAC